MRLYLGNSTALEVMGYLAREIRRTEHDLHRLHEQYAEAEAMHNSRMDLLLAGKKGVCNEL